MDGGQGRRGKVKGGSFYAGLMQYPLAKVPKNQEKEEGKEDCTNGSDSSESSRRRRTGQGIPIRSSTQPHTHPATHSPSVRGSLTGANKGNASNKGELGEVRKPTVACKCVVGWVEEIEKGGGMRKRRGAVGGGKVDIPRSGLSAQWAISN